MQVTPNAVTLVEQRGYVLSVARGRELQRKGGLRRQGFSEG